MHAFVLELTVVTITNNNQKPTLQCRNKESWIILLLQYWPLSFWVVFCFFVVIESLLNTTYLGVVCREPHPLVPCFRRQRPPVLVTPAHCHPFLLFSLSRGRVVKQFKERVHFKTLCEKGPLTGVCSQENMLLSLWIYVFGHVEYTVQKGQCNFKLRKHDTYHMIEISTLCNVKMCDISANVEWNCIA
jgi:hypothetical protein